jgi:predicted lipoprotein with Yx(FWY)xxD motif
MTGSSSFPRRGLPLLGACIAIALALAACGSSSKPAAAPPTVQASQTSLGLVLTNGSGRTLYANVRDTSTTSVCTGSCTSTWIPLTASGTPTAGSNVQSSLLATFTRPDHGRQVTYDGHPLYTYSGDQSSGQTNGQGVGGTWYVVSSTGQIVQPGAVQPGGVPGSTATTSHGATTTTRSTSTSTSKPTTTTTKPTTTTKKPASDETVPSDG